MSEVEVELDDDGGLLTVRQTMRFLQVKSRNTMWSWEQRGHGPKPISIGSPGAGHRTLRYRKADLMRWIGEQS
jgi:predicted DNA-binding transcriptional regulator AlpA